MPRWLPPILVGAIVVAIAAPLGADIEGTTFTSKAANVRMTLPRGWRWADQATYPGIVLRMNRTRPRVTMLLAVDPAPETIDISCRERPAATEGAAPQPYPREVQILCVQARALTAFGFTVGPIKEAARPWFDYASPNRELRQGVAVFDDQVVTLVLAADTTASRAQYARTFDKALRSVRALETRTTSEGTEEIVEVSDASVEAEATDAGVAE